MKRNYWLLMGLLPSLGLSSITDEEAIARAKPLVQQFSPHFLSKQPRVTRLDDYDAPGGIKPISVSFGEAIVHLDQYGKILAYSNLGPSARAPRDGGVDLFDEESAWNALEDVLRHFPKPPNLVRVSMKLGKGGMNAETNAYHFLMQEPPPEGYETEWSNKVWAEIHRTTGKLITVRIVDGWTFEPADVRITADNAREAVRAQYGGNIEDLSVRLMYTTIANKEAPTYTKEMRRNKVLRLHYLVESRADFGFAMVDSVTGEIVSYRNSRTGSEHLVADLDESASSSPHQESSSISDASVDSDLTASSSQARSLVPVVLTSVVAVAVAGLLLFLAFGRK